MKSLILLTAIATGLLTLGCSGRSISINVSDGAAPATATAQAPAAQVPAASPQTAPPPVAQPQAVPQPIAQAAPAQPVAPAPAPALDLSNSNTYIVRTNDGNGVNVRASNSTQSAKIASLLDGAAVMVHGSDRSGEWLEVSAPNRIRGWVAARFLQPASGGGSAPVAAPNNNTMWIRTMDGDGLNVRAEPSLGGKILTSAPNRSAVTVLGTVGQWSHVTTANGVTGYVASDYLVGP